MVNVVYSNLKVETHSSGGLFRGKRFWLSVKVPMRKRFIDEIKANGGEVLRNEQDADYLIADHTRKDIPAGSISFTFIDESLKTGELQDPEHHRAGSPPKTIRDAGSSATSARRSRTPYTNEDERVLTEWIHGSHGETVFESGNEIFKDLERQNSRHTWQSWRDHWIHMTKKDPTLSLRNRDPPAESLSSSPQAVHLPAGKSVPSSKPGQEAPNNMMSPSGIQSERVDPAIEAAAKAWRPFVQDVDWSPLTMETALILLPQSQNLKQIYSKSEPKGALWSEWAGEIKEHSARDWRQGWESKVEPFFDENYHHVGVAGLLKVESDESDSENEDDVQLGSPKSIALLGNAQDSNVRSTVDGVDSQGEALQSILAKRDGRAPSYVAKRSQDPDSAESEDDGALPSLASSPRTSLTKRKREPLGDTIANSSPPQHGGSKLPKRPRLIAAHSSQAQLQPRVDPPLHRSEPAVSAGQSALRHDEVPSSDHSNLESTTSNAKSAARPKSHSSSTDTQGKVDAQILAENDAFIDHSRLEYMEEVDEEVLLSQLEQLKRMQSDRASEEDDEGSDAFDTAPQVPQTIGSAADEVMSERDTNGVPQEPKSPLEPLSPLSALFKGNTSLRSSGSHATLPAARDSKPFSSPKKSVSHERQSPPESLESTTPLVPKTHSSSRSLVQPRAPDVDAEDRPSISEWVESRRSERTSVPEVVDALLATSLNLELSDRLLARLRGGEINKEGHAGGKSWLPVNERGVWTAQDDQDLKAGGMAGRRKVSAKHGEDNVKDRLLYWANKEW